MLKRTLAAVRPRVAVDFHDLARIHPVSRDFGFIRGTPIDRYYIESFLDRHRPLISGRVLEVGGSHYTRHYGGDSVTSCEVLHASPEHPSATIVGDLPDLSSLPRAGLDCFICTETYNFIFDVEQVIRGSYRLLRPGGVLLATVGGLCQISRYEMNQWADYLRFTTLSVRRLFEPVFGPDLEITPYGNVLAANALLQGVAVGDLPQPYLLDESDGDYQVVISIVARRHA